MINSKSINDSIYIGSKSGKNIIEKLENVSINTRPLENDVSKNIGSNTIIVLSSFLIEINWMIDSTEYFNSEYINVTNIELITNTINGENITFKKLTISTTNNIIIPVGTILKFVNMNASAHVIEQIYKNVPGRNELFISDDVLPIFYSGRNISIGSESSENLKRSFNDIFIGYKSGYGSTSTIPETFNNVSIGNYSGYNYTIANTNTLLGTYSNYENTNGNNNVCLGFRSGYYNTGSNCIFIGPDTGENDISNVNGRLYIEPRGLNENGEHYGTSSFIYGDTSYIDDFGDLKPRLLINADLIVNSNFNISGNFINPSFNSPNITNPQITNPQITGTISGTPSFSGNISAVFNGEIKIKDSNNTSGFSGSAVFVHPNDTGNTKLLGSYFNISHGSSTGYLALPEGNSSSQTPYTLATTNSTQTFTNKTINNGTFTRLHNF